MADAYAVEKVFVNSDKRTIPWRSTRSRPKEGASLLLFERNNDDILFTASSRITNAPESDPPAPHEYWEFDEIAHFDEARSLIELAGSLQRTKHFLDPSRDFSEWFVALSKQDFTTVANNTSAIDRSIYRMLFHALPLVLQTAFVRQNADLFPRDRRINGEYRNLANALVDFLDEVLHEPWLLFDRLIATYPHGVKGIPAFDELRLANGTQAIHSQSHDISFGHDGRDLHRALSRVVGGKTDGGRSFLQECREQLQTENHYGEQWQWNDPFSSQPKS